MSFEESYAKNGEENIIGPITKQKMLENDGTMVTVICVTYNHENFIAQALESFVKQKTNFKFKVLVGDDCSPDSTAKIVKKYAEKYPEIIVPVLRNKNIGSKHNLIDLINRANSKYICFCDGDDYWIDDKKLQIQYDFMEENNHLRGCFAKTEILAPKDWYLNSYFKACKDGKRYIPDSIPGYIYKDIISALDIMPKHPLHTSTVFIKWNYDIKIPDWYFYGFLGDIPLFLLQIGNGKIGYIDRVFSVYRRSEVGVHFLKNKNQHFLKTRFEFINYLMGIKNYYSFLDFNFYKMVKPIIDKRIENEVNSYLIAAKNEKSIIAFLKIFFKYPFSIKIFNRKIINKIYEINKKLLKLIYEVTFDKFITKGIKEAFLTLGYKNNNKNLKNNDWNKFELELKNKKIIFLGFAPGVWELIPKKIAIQKVEYIVDLSLTNQREIITKYKNISVYSLEKLKEYDPEKEIILIAYTNNAHIRVALNILKSMNISNYYHYSYMESKRLKNKILKPPYIFYRWMRLWFSHNGLFNNLFLFKIQANMRVLQSIFTSKFSSLKYLKNSANTKRCFIIGNGPSLTVKDLELLNDEITFAVNNIYSIFEKTKWRPTYYAICDPIARDTTLEYFRQHGKDDIPWDDFAIRKLFLPEKIRNFVKSSKAEFISISYLDQHINSDSDFFMYSGNLIYGSYNLRTVVNFCINIAHYMGFKEIYLLGVDCNYSDPVQYFDGSKNILLRGNNNLLNISRSVMLEQGMINAYKYIKKKVNKDNVKIFNASRKTKLDVFEKVQLEKILKIKER